MLDIVRKQIAERYFDSTYGGVDMRSAYDSASAHITNAIGPDAALGAVAWYALQLDDSHTFFAPPSQTVSVEYGWNMMMSGDSCFVSSVKQGSDAEHQGVRVGDQLVSINGASPTRENLWQINYLYRVLRQQPSLHVVMRAPGLEPRQLDLAAKVRQRGAIVDLTGADGGRDIGRMIREGEQEAEQYRGLYLDVADQVMIWKMPTFDIRLDEVRDALRRARKRKALIIDLRGNSGGYIQTLLELIKQVSRDSVVVGTLRERLKTSQLVAKGAGNEAYAGPLYVLVDSRSASASEIFARTMQLSGRGKVLGDRTAGAVMEARYYPLSLGIETIMAFGVQITDADVVMSDGGRLERVGVTPDELLLPTATQLASKRDAVLARALTLAGIPTDAARAGALYPEKNR
ncbi:MAG TPA: S41 family peptidase [Gemmatimonadaceae bacterium]|jgi:C-terminal processing protease CtpA/Prc